MLNLDRSVFMAAPTGDVPYIVWLEDRDGETVRSEAFDTVEELLKDWPHAKRISSHEFEAYVGGGR